MFELGDKKANSLLTYRSDLIYFSISDNWETVKMKINNEKHSSYLVCENGNIDEILGIVLLKDLFGVVEGSLQRQIRRAARHRHPRPLRVDGEGH